MDLLILETLEGDIVEALRARYSIRIAPELAQQSASLHRALESVRALVAPASVAIDAALLSHAPRLRAVGRITAGVENIDADACARAGVEVVRSENCTAQADAEFSLCALLTMLRRVPVMGSDGVPIGRELGGRTVGLIGLTPAARTMSRLLASFGAGVVGYDPAVHRDDGVWMRWNVEPTPLRELLERSDAVSVQLGFFSRYRGLLGERLLQHCKHEQVLLNLGHSALFDAEALAGALASGRIAAAWFDSLEPGMLRRGQPLAGFENLQVTPRIASTTLESRRRCARAVTRRIDRILRGDAGSGGEPFTRFRSADPTGPSDAPRWR